MEGKVLTATSASQTRLKDYFQRECASERRKCDKTREQQERQLRQAWGRGGRRAPIDENGQGDPNGLPQITCQALQLMRSYVGYQQLPGPTVTHENIQE